MATKDRPFISKPSQDFLRRVAQTSGVSDATAHPEGPHKPYTLKYKMSCVSSRTLGACTPVCPAFLPD